VRGENPETPDSRTSFYEFTAPPEKDAPVRILVVGDMQPKPKEAVTIHGGALVAAGIVREKPDLVVQLGDLSYIGGFFNYWFPLLQNISAFSPFVPMQAVPGNHDQYVDGGRNYAEFFPYDFASGKGLYYSFNIGSAHFVMINAFEKGDEKITDTQKEWVERDIAAARESGMEWIFLAVHDCVLSTGTEGTSEPLLAWIVPLADRMDVDAVFYGHDHHYEHWLVEYGKNGLVFDPADTPLGNPVQYFCAGGGGGRLEVDYGLMTREPASFVRRMYRLPGGEPFDLEIAQNPWDSSVYIDRTDNPDYGQPFGGKHYYQAPPGPTCQTDTAWFGYEYGEQTLHYILIEIEGNEARISVRYPNGDLLAGPDGRYPQEFILTRD